jgi:hypothetical protein
MLYRHEPSCRNVRRGAASTELALILPMLLFFVGAATDFARVASCLGTIATCAGNGALYGSQDAAHAADLTNIQAQALLDAGNLSPAPTCTRATGTDTAGNPFIEVTVTYPFSTVIAYPGIPSALTLSRTVRMRIAP